MVSRRRGDDKARLSRALSYALRHAPASLDLTLDSAGWADVDRVLAGLHRLGKGVSRAELEAVVTGGDKTRFAISEDGLRIRALQGHSIEVALGYPPARPPELLFHGTIPLAIEAIRQRGLRRGQRHHVHLSADRETAFAVGARRGGALVLTVDALRMFEDGFVFYRADNGVWLTERVPPPYLHGLGDRAPG